MEDHSNLDHLSLRLDDNDELNALTLTTLLNSGVEEALSNLSPAQLIQLEKNVQKLKKQKAPAAPLRKRSEMESPKVEKRRKFSSESNSGIHSGGQYMNLPASAPHVEVKDGMELLYFTYSTKGHVQEYCIRIDIDDITLEEIPEDFKNDNCVYPRALVPREAYTGNRYDYETSVNELSWKLTWLNAETLASKRGLIQRAVDSYRNRTTESRSRRVLRQQKLHEGILRRRSAHDHHEEMNHHDHRLSPKTITLQYTSKTGETSRIKLRVDLESVDLSQIDDSFRQSNCLYPQALHMEADYSGSSRLAYELSSNEIAWKLAWLNPTKLANQPNILPKAVDAYRARFENRETQYMEHETARLADSVLGKGSDFSEMVAHTLQQVLGQHDDDLHSQVSLEDHLAASDHMREDDEDRPRTMSTADLLGGI